MFITHLPIVAEFVGSVQGNVLMFDMVIVVTLGHKWTAKRTKSKLSVVAQLFANDDIRQSSQYLPLPLVPSALFPTYHPSQGSAQRLTAGRVTTFQLALGASQCLHTNMSSAFIIPRLSSGIPTSFHYSVRRYG